MTKRYWLDLFTGKTWEEFLKNGANVSGFRETRKTLAKQIQPGDYFVCYMTGIKRFIAVLEARSAVYEDRSKLWEDEDFPVRFKVEVVYKLEPEMAVPIDDLRDRLSMFQNLRTPNSWVGFFRGSPGEFKASDGVAIVDAIKLAMTNPVRRPYDLKMYQRRPLPTYESKHGEVTVPEDEKEPEPIEPLVVFSHEEIQWLLLKLGSDLGLDVWVARNDRNKVYNGQIFKDMPRIKDELPVHFDSATKRTIELIDVLWLKKDTIVAAFEVEHTTAIYSGLLRMADLISMQPNIKIDLYMVAPNDRHDRVITEVNRPTFKNLSPPLPKLCKFIPYSKLKEEVQRIGESVRHMKPSFIDDVAEACELGEP